MSDWLGEDWLLPTALSRRLYHDVAAPLPIIDYHCHLDAADLADDRRFDTITDLWITPDPYKHRAMRMLGVPEAIITGQDTAPRVRFEAWAAALPKLLGNPLHAWAAMELARTFDTTGPLTPASFDTLTAALQLPTRSARGLIDRAHVACICTSDRLLDDLDKHRLLAASGWATRVLPSLRGDDILAVDAPAYRDWLRQLGAATGVAVTDFPAFTTAVQRRLDAFAAAGCRLADHSLDGLDEYDHDADPAPLLDRVLAGQKLDAAQRNALHGGLLRMLAAAYAKRGWVLQLHLGAQRQTSTRLRTLAGPAGGYACLGSPLNVPALARLLDDLERGDALPRVILYNLNPADHAAMATLTGSFAADGVPGQVLWGPAWWFNDHALGIRQHLDTLAHYGLLWTFPGMTTDSRSLLSMVRHEYFRRLLCGWVGEQVDAGLMPADDASLNALVRGMCHDNARRMLQLDEEPAT